MKRKRWRPAATATSPNPSTPRRCSASSLHISKTPSNVSRVGLEIAGANAELAHLEVQRLVVGAERARRLAFVALGHLQGVRDRVTLGGFSRLLGDFLERVSVERRLTRSRIGFHVSQHVAQVARTDREILRA